MHLAQISYLDLPLYGISPQAGLAYYRLKQDYRNEKFSEWGRKVSDWLKVLYPDGNITWTKAPKILEGESFSIWYYTIKRVACSLKGEPSSYSLTSLGLDKKTTRELVKKEYETKEGQMYLSIPKIDIKLQLIVKDTIQYYKDITFDKRINEYSFQSQPTVWQKQIDGIDKVLSQREVFLTLPVGAGKSLIAMYCANRLVGAGKRCLILCQKNKISDWQRDSKSEGVGKFTDVINHDAITTLFTIGKTKRKTFTKKITGKFAKLWANDYDYIIVDEVTDFKNKSNRGLCLKKFMEMKGIKHRVFLTGTPYYTGIKDIWGMLSNCTNHPLSKLSVDEFEFYWNYQANNEQASKEAKKKRQDLLKSLFLPSLFCKTFLDYPQDQQPPKFIIKMIPLEPPEGYIIKCKYFIKKAKEVKIQTGANTFKLVDTSIVNMRIAAAKFKVDWVKNWIDQNKDKKVFPVSTWNVGVLNDLSDEFQIPIYKGGINQKERRQLVDNFVDGEYDIFLGNMQSTAMGMSDLQNVCNNMIIMNVPHQAGMLEQLIGRLVRPRKIGSLLQDEVVTIWIPYFTGFKIGNKTLSVEEDKFRILQIRAGESQEITGAGIIEKIGEAFDFEDSTVRQVKELIDN